MVEDHCPAVEAIVWEFYVIEVNPMLISVITIGPRVCDPTYPYPADYFPAHADLVACFAEGRPY
jgi:hypothetical protein